MNMTQAWPVVAITVAIIGVLLRQMSLQRSELITRVDGVESRLDVRIDGLDAKLSARIDGLDAKSDGLRNELLAILNPMARQLERLDQDMREVVKARSGGG